MIAWLLNNWSTIVVGLVLLGLLGGIILHMIRQKRRGESPCGCGCSNCAMNGTCHAAQAKEDKE